MGEREGFLRILHFLLDRSGHRFLSGFASFSDPRSDENWFPEVCERDPQKDTKKMLRLEGFGIELAWILGPNLDPGGRSAKAVLLFFLCSWSCVEGKMAPGCPKSASKTDFGPIMVDLGSIFNEFLMLLPPFLLALKRELSVEFGPLCRYRGYCCVLPSCANSLSIHSQSPFIEARWRR